MNAVFVLRHGKPYLQQTYPTRYAPCSLAVKNDTKCKTPHFSAFALDFSLR